MHQQPCAMQQRILRYIATSVRDNELPPTNREIVEGVGASSTGHISYHLAQLEKMGYLGHLARKSRGLRLLAKAQAYREIDPVDARAV